MGLSTNQVANTEDADTDYLDDMDQLDDGKINEVRSKSTALIDIQDYQKSLLEGDVDVKFQDYESISQF